MLKHLSTAVALLIIGGVCGLALTRTHELTRAPIEENRIRHAQALLNLLLGHEVPTDLSWNNGVANVCGDWQFVRTARLGYSGPIEYLALLANGTISLRVTRHQETPGIADFIDHQKAAYLPNLDRTAVSKWSDLDNISGATITHKALRAMATQAQNLRNDQRQQTDCKITHE